MPYKDAEKQREADNFYHKRRRDRLKAEAEARNEKFLEEIPETPENLNYGMKNNPEKPMTWEEYLAENPKATQTEWIQYKIKFSSEHTWKTEKETLDRRRARDEQTKYGTLNHDCLLWRRHYSNGQKSDFLYNHIDVCRDCMRWYARHKNQSTLDLNATKDKPHFEELDGYAEMFREKEPFPEDFTGYPYPMSMSKMCPNCLSNLRPDGSCPVCDPHPDE